MSPRLRYAVLCSNPSRFKAAPNLVECCPESAKANPMFVELSTPSSVFTSLDSVESGPTLAKQLSHLVESVEIGPKFARLEPN